MDIVGASGHAKVILEILELNKVKVTGIWDDNEELGTFMGLPLKGSIQACIDQQPSWVIIALGNNGLRKKVAGQLVSSAFGHAFHPSSVISSSAALGTGTVAMPNSSINAGTVTGSHVIINTNASVDHDCVLGDYVHISPQAGIAGNVEIGEGTHIGIGASVIQGIRIGCWCTIGAGAVIIDDVPDGVTVVGNPGRILRK
jgi:acetyltransferase EpsM